MSPLAYFLTWTTYGSWLQGDPRNWIRKDEFLIQSPHEGYRRSNENRLVDPPVRFTLGQRKLVQEIIAKHCQMRGWELHAVYVGISHVHVVVGAEATPEKALSEFKAWCSRRLNQPLTDKKRWWSRHGSTRWLNDEKSLEAAIQYVLEGQ